VTTTVHLAPDLIARIDRRARELGISRNRFIARALERTIEEQTEWSPRFIEVLEHGKGDAQDRKAVDEMMGAIRSRRSRKKPRAL
jgi:predicted transcriptional regulator